MAGASDRVPVFAPHPEAAHIRETLTAEPKMIRLLPKRPLSSSIAVSGSCS